MPKTIKPSCTPLHCGQTSQNNDTQASYHRQGLRFPLTSLLCSVIVSIDAFTDPKLLYFCPVKFSDPY